jgi:hypothetical protein
MDSPRRKGVDYRVVFDTPAEALASNVCVCGAAKVPDRPFCGDCFDRLSEATQRALMHRPAGTILFDAAYESARGALAA